MLCRVCLPVFSRNAPRYMKSIRQQPHHKDKGSFTTALEQGCFMCKALLSEIWDWRAFRSDSSRPFSSTCDVLKDRSSYYVSLTVASVDTKYSSRYSSRLFTLVPSHLIQNLLPSSQQTRHRISTARAWISECLENHQACKEIHRSKAQVSGYRPRRLVDIGYPGSISWKLTVNVESARVETSYATLSHRWSNTPSLLLTGDNEQRLRRDAQPIISLPKTFQDAIFVAHSLGIRYIWIDCLCIIQDSAEDWEYESQQMGKIYSHSVVNISASGALDNKSSFLDRSQTPIPLPPVVNPPWAPTQPQGYRIIDKYFWWAQITSQSLMKRGWVYQERFLAPRVLHFGSEQMLWECSSLDACETFPRGLPAHCHNTRHTQFKTLRRKKSGSEMESASQQPDPLPHIGQNHAQNHIHLAKFWSDQIHNYTRTSLTKPGDKLPALSGVAELALNLFPLPEGTTSPRYLAGLFDTRHLLLLLEWHAIAGGPEGFPPQLKTSRPNEYRAPSWSWASIDGRVGYDYFPYSRPDADDADADPSLLYFSQDENHPDNDGVRRRGSNWVALVSELEARVTPAHVAFPLGRVSDGFLRLNGRLVPDPRRHSKGQVTIRPDTPPLPSSPPSGREAFVPLRCIEANSQGEHTMYFMTGLMLEQVERSGGGDEKEEQEPCYRRTGLFFVRSKLDKESLEETEGLEARSRRLLEVEFGRDIEMRRIKII